VGSNQAAVDLGGAEHQLGERQLEQRLDLLQRPVVARPDRGSQLDLRENE
jgi:hypothetical protein